LKQYLAGLNLSQLGNWTESTDLRVSENRKGLGTRVEDTRCRPRRHNFSAIVIDKYR
jgi:hypothetical protein